MAKTEAQPQSPAEIVDASWSAPKLIGVGLLTLLVSLSVIIFLGSRLGGCMYVDGSHGPSEFYKGK